MLGAGQRAVMTATSTDDLSDMPMLELFRLEVESHTATLTEGCSRWSARPSHRNGLKS